jgi:hypothetical protein
VVAIVLVLAMRTGSVRLTILAIVAGLGATWGTWKVLGPQLTGVALDSGNRLIAHQVAGLMNPMDPNQSTFLAHQEMAINGIISSFDHPFGLGTAATNQAALRLSGTFAGTEVDLPNTFVSLGILGGLLFSILIIVTLWRAGGLALSSRHPIALATVGVLIVSFGQWLNGGYYAVAPLVWVLIGCAHREWIAQRETRRTAGRLRNTDTTFSPRQGLQAAAP